MHLKFSLEIFRMHRTGLILRQQIFTEEEEPLTSCSEHTHTHRRRHLWPEQKHTRHHDAHNLIKQTEEEKPWLLSLNCGSARTSFRLFRPKKSTLVTFVPSLSIQTNRLNWKCMVVPVAAFAIKNKRKNQSVLPSLNSWNENECLLLLRVCPFARRLSVLVLHIRLTQTGYILAAEKKHDWPPQRERRSKHWYVFFSFFFSVCGEKRWNSFGPHIQHFNDIACETVLFVADRRYKWRRLFSIRYSVFTQRASTNVCKACLGACPCPVLFMLNDVDLLLFRNSRAHSSMLNVLRITESE